MRVLGARHSFNDLAAIDGQADGDPETHEPVEESSWAYISLEKLNAPVTFDSSRGTVTCGAGITYGELCQRMHVEGVALHNMASLPHITVAGACATGTHGSGDGNGNLSTAVVGLELVTANGELRSLTHEENRETFEGAVVALGGLGVVTRVTLATEPAFAMQQYVYEDMASVDLYEHFDEVMSSAYSVSLFPDWQDGTCQSGLAQAPNRPVGRDSDVRYTFVWNRTCSRYYSGSKGTIRCEGSGNRLTSGYQSVTCRTYTANGRSRSLAR